MMCTLRVSTLALILSINMILPLTTNAFFSHHHHLQPTQTIQSTRSSSSSFRFHTPLFLAKNNNDDDDDEDEIDLSGQDWRAFRAKLVMQPETSSSDDDDDLDGIGAVLSSKTSTPWAYESGFVIEQGAVILGGVDQDFGFGLRQQYFHKVAILVLEHDEQKFTRGVILNRPTDMFLDDEKEWRVWFGGDVQGLGTILPDVVCLHSLEGEEAKEVSMTVMKDIQCCSFDNAKQLVKTTSYAKPSDFWVFGGYAGWGPGQLLGELERKSWYMVATDSQTLLKELQRQAANADPRDAGLDTWELLMDMIGKGEKIAETKNDFDDLMLKEWAREELCSDYKRSSSIMATPPPGVASTQELFKASPIDKLMKRVKAVAKGEDVTKGTLLRASSAQRSPFLLKKQEFHKSIMLILSDDENLTVGVMLNHPAAKGLDLEIVDKTTRKRKVVSIPLRYGGEYAIKGQHPLLWLHCNDILKKAKVGSPVNDIDEDGKGIWKCTSDQATAAMGQGIASYTDFMIVSGVSVWTKGEKGLARGMQGEVRKGNFQIVDSDKTKQVWDALQKQEVLSDVNLIKNLAIGNAAWRAAGDGAMEEMIDENDVMDGIGDGYDEENESLVFKSDVRVTTLSDDALKSWVATFLLGAPSLG